MNGTFPNFLKICTFRQLKKQQSKGSFISRPWNPNLALQWAPTADWIWESRAEERSFTLLPKSLMICLASLILDLSEAFDSVNHKVLVTRLWSMAGVGWAPFEVSWWVHSWKVVMGNCPWSTYISQEAFSLLPILPTWAGDLDDSHLIIIFSTDPCKLGLVHSYFGLGRK